MLICVQDMWEPRALKRPAIRPFGLRYERGVGGWFTSQISYRGEVAVPIPEEVAAALWRESVSAWLGSWGYLLWMEPAVPILVRYPFFSGSQVSGVVNDWSAPRASREALAAAFDYAVEHGAGA